MFDDSSTAPFICPEGVDYCRPDDFCPDCLDNGPTDVI